MSRKTQDLLKGNPNAPHSRNLANITGGYSCSQNPENYISDVTSNKSFFLILEKYRELKPACQTISKNLTPYEQRTAVSSTIVIGRELYNARLFCGTNWLARHRSGKPWTEIPRSSMKRYYLNVVSGLPTAHKLWYIFFATSLKRPNSLRAMRARHCLFWINAECVRRRLFH